MKTNTRIVVIQQHTLCNTILHVIRHTVDIILYTKWTDSQ